ncbi:Ig-like domain-containing protein, partial [Burkholderia ubonensis]|uniref:Ig-like domain-containing protein n=1 Tax=Burkholderia ubonensis TaxID=101571 RepID=UPI000AF59694
FTVQSEDAAGNVSASEPFTLIVDTTAPTAQAVVQSMGKDSGTDGDYLTNDGSAGRLIRGTIEGTLAEGDKVQVSTDGGRTWLDAIVGDDGQWLFVDKHAHTDDFQIQTRVVDEAGNSGAPLAHDVTLDTEGPNAPKSVTRNGDTIEVDLTDTGAQVGDRVNVMIGNERIDHVLTDADIQNGKASIFY